MIFNLFRRFKEHNTAPSPDAGSVGTGAGTPLLMVLEPRVMFDASVVAVAAEPVAHEKPLVLDISTDRKSVV